MSLPSQKNYEYGIQLAYKLACEQLAGIDDIEQQCRRSGAQYKAINSRKIITLQYLNRPYQVILPDIEISLVGSAEEIPLKDKILILHYFTSAKGIPLTNKATTYKELPEGATYFPTFAKRAIKPILDHFGQEPHLLVETAKELGGSKASYGDASVTINAFSQVPITFVLWQGDEEFAPEGNILFDSSIPDYLSTEDINVLCERIAWKLVRLSKEGRN